MIPALCARPDPPAASPSASPRGCGPNRIAPTPRVGFHPRQTEPGPPHPVNLPSSRQAHLRRILTAPLWILALGTWLLRANAQGTDDPQAIVGPFLPGSGMMTLVPGGDFETGPAELPVNSSYGPLVGDMELFVSAGASGTAQRTPLAAVNGSSGVIIRPGRFDGAGIALTYYQTLAVPPGQGVVLSAFVKRVKPVGSRANVALDFWGALGTGSIPVPATTSEWQFVQGVFQVPPFGGVMSLGARVVIDGEVTPEDEVLVDDLSLTPLFLFAPPIQGGVVTGPFAPGSGSWTVLPGGDFEAGPHELPVNTRYGPLKGDMELFQSRGASASAFRSNSAAFRGSKGVDLQSGTFQGAGVAVTYYDLYPVQPGASVVLSVLVRRANPAASKARVFLDFWDAPGTTRIVAKPLVDEWQMLHATYTAPKEGGPVMLGARVGVDGEVTPDDHIFIDELAITPSSGFVLPKAASSGSVSGAEGAAELANGFVVGIRLSTGGSGYTDIPRVLILGGGGTGAAAVATVSGGVVTRVEVTNAGRGYTGTPIVRIEPPRPAPPEGAKATATLIGGSVAEVGLNRFGSGYSRTPGVQLIGGGGSGAAATARMTQGVVVGVTVTDPGSGYTRPPMVIIDPPVPVPTPPYSVATQVKTVTVTLTVAPGRIYVLETSPDLHLWTLAGDPFEPSASLMKQDFDVSGRPAFFRLRDVTVSGGSSAQEEVGGPPARDPFSTPRAGTDRHPSP